ncbi:histone H2B type 3-B-like [Anomaloglossus baeobatrachus]|uniref:histone H2B type 3-B-like n=1 Tax=Anomaloglossus baeobatrachus TaxID=238106 RepID=UPI003F508497
MKCSPAAVSKMEAGNQRSAELRSRGKSETYSRFIYRLIKQGSLDQSVGLSKESDLILAIASEAARLSLYNKRRTITRWELESAVKNVSRAGPSAATE